jgi:prevent-host-death family protein
MYIWLYISLAFGGTMTKSHSIADARKNLPGLIRDAESGEAIELTRRGQPVAVLISTREYERLHSPARRFSEAWETFRGAVDLAELEIDPGEIFESVRASDPGRGVDL